MSRPICANITSFHCWTDMLCIILPKSSSKLLSFRQPAWQEMGQIFNWCHLALISVALYWSRKAEELCFQVLNSCSHQEKFSGPYYAGDRTRWPWWFLLPLKSMNIYNRGDQMTACKPRVVPKQAIVQAWVLCTDFFLWGMSTLNVWCPSARSHINILVYDQKVLPPQLPIMGGRSQL